jgi:hypothetical protein
MKTENPIDPPSLIYILVNVFISTTLFQTLSITTWIISSASSLSSSSYTLFKAPHSFNHLTHFTQGKTRCPNWNNYHFILFCYCFAGWGYTGVFTKILTMYQIYHN